MFLRDQGRLKEAMPQLRRATQLAPSSVMACLNLAYGLLAEGNNGAALEQARRAAELAPELASAYLVLLHAMRAAGQTRDADVVLSRALAASAGDPHAMSLVAGELARLGRNEASRKLVADIDALARMRYVSPFDRGKVSIALGDGDRALNLLEEAYRQRSSGLIFLRDFRCRVSDAATAAFSRSSIRCTSRADTAIL